MLIDGLGMALNIVIIIVAILIFIVAIWGGFLQLSIFFRYQANNRKRIGGGKTAKTVAEEMLRNLGYTDIRVERASYFWLIFFSKWGNRYSPRRKKILLYGNIINKDTVTAIALATQKVGLVMQHKQGEKRMMFRAKWELWTRMAPNLFLPITVIGVLIDYLVFGANPSMFGYITLVFVIIAIVWTIIAFYCLYLIIPTERRAGQLAFENIKKNNLLTGDHLRSVEAMYATYVKKYIADFIMAILELIWDILYVLIRIKGKR